MKTVFADTHYWIAIAWPNDPFAGAAKKAKEQLGSVILITTDEVLTEFLAGLCKWGPELRQAAVKMVRAIMVNPNIRVLPQSRDSFLQGLDRYEKRLDKQYSLTDCISMNAMEVEGIREALTHDHHFAQEGMIVLINDKAS